MSGGTPVWAGYKPQVRYFVAIGAIFLAIQAAMIVFSWAAIEVINLTRAYAAGESAYSKSQKSAVLSLHRYAETGRAEHYAAFLDAMAVPMGNMVARLALERNPPDIDHATARLLEGGNHPRDVLGMVYLFIWLGDWGPFKRAIEEWRLADPLIDDLLQVGHRLHQSIVEGRLTPDLRESLLREADRLDRGLTVHEEFFAQQTGVATRAARDLLVLSLGLGSALLWGVGLGLVWRVYRKGLTAEHEVAMGKARFRDFAEVASDWFWETDADLRLSYVSPQFLETTGVRPEDAIGKRRSDFTDEDLSDPRWRENTRTIAARLPYRNFVYRFKRPDGGLQYCSFNGKPQFDEAGKFFGYRGTGTDVTELVVAEQKARAAREQAELANRSKSEFLANMSHELRTPLNAIMGFSEIMNRQILGPLNNPSYVEYAGDIHRSADHLLGIINDILDLSKIEAGKTELHEGKVDVAALANAVRGLLKERAVAGSLSLETHIQTNLPPILADERKLKQILTNLVSNAVKFTPPGGRVAIAASIDDDGELALSVSDTGIGMAQEDIPKALAPFGQIDSSLSRRYQGTGLGLPLTKLLVELHEGRLHIDSALGRGTCVWVHLPRRRVLAQETQAAIASPSAAAKR